LVFAVDPRMWVPEENLYIRIEDTVAVTATGVKYFTGLSPIDLDGIKRLMKKPGMVQSFPPVPTPPPTTGSPAR
jgi:Xaa-Pro aminopeptidase